MKIIVWFFFASNCARAIIDLVLIAANKYPRKMERNAGDDALALAVRIGFAVWALWVLFH
jgi:hypothetical protein